MELVATGRTAEVYASGPGRVVKLDRPEWRGLAAYELGVLERVHAAGLPVPRPYGTVRVDGRDGVELERLHGPTLGAVLGSAPSVEVAGLARDFAALQRAVHATVVEGLPELLPRLRDEVRRSGLAAEQVHELVALVDARSQEPVALCHGDLHPGNVIVTPEGWRVVDWVNAATGPPAADVARTLVLLDEARWRSLAAFRRQLDGGRVGDRERAAWRDWYRVVAAARQVELS